MIFVSVLLLAEVGCQYNRSTYNHETIDRLRTADATVVVPSLLKALKSRDAGRRKVAAEALGVFPMPEVCEALLKALTDRDEDVRDTAGSALSEFDDPAILPRLAAILATARDPTVRADMIRAMRFYGAPAADVLKATLQQALSTQLNPLFRLHTVVYLPARPRTASNKVLRRDLREQALRDAEKKSGAKQ